MQSISDTDKVSNGHSFHKTMRTGGRLALETCPRIVH